MHRHLLPLLLLALLASPSHAAFLDTGQQNLEYDRTHPGIVAWASGVADYLQGPVDYQNPSLGHADFGAPQDVLGASGTSFSLGDGGSITLTFDLPIVNEPGPDFVVFENGFAFGGGVYMEVGVVEVSSDGTTFSRLPAICRRTTQPGSFDPGPSPDFYNLAGNFVGGTAFDLEDLVDAEDPQVLLGTVDLGAITHVRIVDVVGHIAGAALTDFFGTPIADPYPTPFASGGFDATGVGVIHQMQPVAVEATTWGRLKAVLGR